MTAAGTPSCSVVICAYNSRRRIDVALRSLQSQDLDEPFEAIAVVSGEDGCADHLATAHPEVRIIRSDRRLFPGAARNAGVCAARGPIVAFLPDDGIADRCWLRARLERHREGYPLVAGAISNATPTSLVGTAGYYVEYAASLPVERVLEQQAIPHTLSYRREVFTQLGMFPEIDHPGEDTLFNRRCLEAGLPVSYEPRATIAHRNLRGLLPFLRHQAGHGRGLARCITEHGFDGPFDPCAGQLRTAYDALIRYPHWRWRSSARLVCAGGRSHAAWFLAITPLAALGYLAGGIGALRELRRAGDGALP